MALDDGHDYREVSEWLGHADYATTLRVYAYWIPDARENNMSAPPVPTPPGRERRAVATARVRPGAGVHVIWLDSPQQVYDDDHQNKDASCEAGDMKFLGVIMASILAVAAVLPVATAPGSAEHETDSQTVVRDFVNLADSSLMGPPQPPQLSDAEKQALEDEKTGRPVADPKVLNSAKQKIKEGEKYSGDRNKQKRGKKR